MIVYYSYIDKQKPQTRMITFVWVALGLHKNIKQDKCFLRTKSAY